MRYRPHPVAAMISEKQHWVNLNGKSVDATTFTYGESQQISKGNFIEVIYKINKIETLAKGERKSEHPNITATVLLEPNGKIKDNQGQPYVRFRV
jgi:hypothetical protein